MGTTYTVKAISAEVSQPRSREIHEAIEDALVTVNRRMSTYDPESEISRFNRARDDEPIPVSTATAQVVAEAKRIHGLSDGRFDVTAGPLIELWGFGSAGRRTQPPPVDAIRAARASVGSDRLKVTLEPPTLRKETPQLRVDLSALAKGFGVDVVSELLSSKGLSSHMVEIGGEVVARGENQRGQPWRLGIERPTGSDKRDVQRVVRLTDAALATSGDYRIFFEHEGKRYSHTLDPSTGWPVSHDLASVTVIAPTCMEADALATAVRALGPKKGIALLERTAGVEGLLLLRDGPDRFRERGTAGVDRFLEAK